MASSFLMQIVNKSNGEIVQFEPGLSVEVNFVDACVTKILEKGVGLGRTSKHVANDIRDGIEETIQELKNKIRLQ